MIPPLQPSPPFAPTITQPITTPATPARIKHGAYMICVNCRFAEEFCRCTERSPDAPSADDKASASLENRIREARQNAGGR